MINENERNQINLGLVAGNNINEALTDQIVDQASKMLDQALKENFNTLLQAKLSRAIKETLDLHLEESKKEALRFLSSTKNGYAQDMLINQHTYQVTPQSEPDLILEFDTDLKETVKALADESGSLIISNPESPIGF